MPEGDYEEDLVLDRTTNRVVVHIAGRRFPGMLVQGDGLHALTALARELRHLAACRDKNSKETDLAEDILERLEDLLDHYKSVLKQHGYSLPFNDASP